MTIDDLKNVRRQRLRVITLQERIDRLRSRAEYTQRQLGECGASDPARDRLAEYAADLDELESELTGEMITLERAVMAVDPALAALPPNQEIVLRLRYCEGKKWKEVAAGARYSEGHCRNVNRRFIKEITQNYI